MVRRAAAALVVFSSVLLLTSCLARRRLITRNKAAPSQRLLTADKASLLAAVERQYQSIQTLSATVDMVPAIGSVNKGKITEYKDVTAYILYKKPSDIRIIGLYPVVRNKAFDMVSNGTDFQLFVPAKNRFIIGTNEPLAKPAPDKLENLRPSVFLDALLVRPPAPTDQVVLADLTDEDNADYILHILNTGSDGQLRLVRWIWFDRTNLQMARQILFDPKGEILTDARYTDWSTFDGVSFPKVIDINRPQDEYGVVITVVKATINKSITNEKFTLQQPEGTVLQVLGAKKDQPPPPQPVGGSSASRKKKPE